MIQKRTNWLVGAILCAAFTACVPVGDYQEETRTFPLDNY